MKILVTIEDGRIRACANGNVQVFVEDMNQIGGIEQIKASEIPDADLTALLNGRDTGEPKINEDDFRVDR